MSTNGLCMSGWMILRAKQEESVWLAWNVLGALNRRTRKQILRCNRGVITSITRATDRTYGSRVSPLRSWRIFFFFFFFLVDLQCSQPRFISNEWSVLIMSLS